MSTYVLMYEGFAQFEVVIASLLCKSVGEVVTVGMDDKMITSTEGFQMIPHKLLKDVDIEQVSLFVIPGGDPTKLFEYDELFNFIQALDEKNKPLAAICAAPIILAQAGVLKDKKYTTSYDVTEHEVFEKNYFINDNVVVDGNIITAKGSGYVDFAIEIGKVLNIYKNEADLQETIDFFKYFKS